MNLVSIELMTGTMVFISFESAELLNSFCRQISIPTAQPKICKKGKNGIIEISLTHQNPLLKEVKVLSILLKPDNISFLSI